MHVEFIFTKQWSKINLVIHIYVCRWFYEHGDNMVYTHKTDNSYNRQSSKGRKKNRDKKKETVHMISFMHLS